jgi:hypothetical protein
MKKLIFVSLALLFVAGTALADWQPGDGHKMHFPQLPDPDGWDINITGDFMWDDWKCSQSGPVEDIHFWLSNKGDVWDWQTQSCPIARLIVYIYSDVAADDPANEYDFSHPGDSLWMDDLDPFNPTLIRHAGTGEQGWIDWQQDPAVVIPHDHADYYQINLTDFADPFYQEEGTIYWLGLHLHTYDDKIWNFGWTTSQDHWNDDAVWYYGGWNEMIDPDTGESMDLAFVITPEPATMILLGLGGLLLRRRRSA